MVQITEMTDREKLKMYMKCSKRELAKMLIESNKHLNFSIKGSDLRAVQRNRDSGDAPLYTTITGI